MHFVTVDVFTNTPFLGNPLAIVIVEDHERSALDEKPQDGLTTKQRIAKEFNLSETVFLYLRPGESLTSPDKSSPEREISIYTIESELPFAGHPTIGTAYFVLQHLEWSFITTLTPPAGPIHISTTPSGVSAKIPHDVHHHDHTLRILYELGDKSVTAQIHPALHPDATIRAAELDAPIFSIVKGMTFLLVALPSLGHLAQVGEAASSRRLDLANCVSLLDAGSWGSGFVARYYYVAQATAEGEDGVRVETVRARMVELGFEDPATGSAASALGCCLSLGEGRELGRTRYRVTQGVEIGRTSEIELEVDTGEGDGGRGVKEVRLGGEARLVMSGTLSL